MLYPPKSDKKFNSMTPQWIFQTQFNSERLQKAFDMAEFFHKHQMRKDGQPYLIHPVAVAELIYKAGGDEDMICSAFLHDVIEDAEDTKFAAQEIEKNMGKMVYFTVDALSKERNLTCKTEQQNRFFEQFKNAISQDISVFFIKIADLIHNLQTIGGLKEEKRKKWIQELKDGYLPILTDFYGLIPLPHRNMYHHLVDELELELSKNI